MKRMKKSLSFLLCICMLALCLSVLPVSAGSEYEGTVYEAVLLIDTSESMEFSDSLDAQKHRVSIESIKSFAEQCTKDCDFYLSVVLYNSTAYTLIESMNVSTENGQRTFAEQLDVLYEDNKTFGTESGEFECWAGKTNIGSALDYADKILEKSKADKKAVLLFTDGKIELGDRNAEQASADLAVSVSEKFGKNEIPLYCVGLNKSGTVDKMFLEAIADRTGNDENPGLAVVCTNASELTEFFHKIYAYFTNSSIEIDVPAYLMPNIPQTKKFEVYQDAVKELNINLSADAQLEKIKITDPSGNAVLDIVRGEEQFYCDEELCEINELGCNITHITLYYPMGGEWSVTLESKTHANVSIGRIFVDDLTCRLDIPEKVLVGEVFDCNVTMFAERTENKIPGGKIYEDSVCTLAIYDAEGALMPSSSEGKINVGKDGYSAQLSLQEPGVYTVRSFIRNAQFEVETETTIEVAEPALRLSGRGTDVTAELVNPFTMERVEYFPSYLMGENMTLKVYKDDSFHNSVEIELTSFADGRYVFDLAKDYVSGDFYCIASINGKNQSNKYYFDINDPGIMMESNGNDFKIKDDVSLTITLYDKETSLPYTELPRSFEGEKVTLTINKNGSIHKQESIPMSRFQNGVYTYPFDSAVQGNFTCVASISTLELTSETINVNIVNLPVEVISQPKDIKGEIKLKNTDKFEYNLSLNDLFADGDGHTLTYSVSVSDSDKIIVDRQGDALLLTIKENLSGGTVTITADDGHGSTADVAFGISVTVIEPVSPVVIIVTVSIIIGVLLLIAVVVLIVAKKTSVIDTRFKMTITVPNPEGGVFEVEYKKTMPPIRLGEGSDGKSLADILNNNHISSSDPDSLADRTIKNTGILRNIYVKGLPFHKGIKLYDSAKQSGFWRKSDRTKAATLRHRENNISITVKLIGE